MSKPESNYMWGNVDNTIQIIESRIDWINRKNDLYDPGFCFQDNDVCSQQSSHIIGEFMPMKNNMILCMVLSPNVHPLMNGSLSWKVISIQGGRIIQRHFHHLAMNSHLNQKTSPWKMTILFIQWNRKIYVVMILDELFPTVWCFMASSWVQ